MLDTEGLKAKLKRELAAAIANGDREQAAKLEEQLYAGDEQPKTRSSRPSRKAATTRPRGRHAQTR